MHLPEILKLKDEGGLSRCSEADLRDMLNECEAQLFSRMSAEAKDAGNAIREELARRSTMKKQAAGSVVPARKVPRVLVIAVVLSALAMAALIFYLRWRQGMR